jgi:hypothetical protein
MALIKCRECQKEVSDSAISCPGCGAPIASAALKKGDNVPYSDQEVAVMLSKKKKTSHLLHLVMSIITLGFWVIIWFIVALSNSMENKSIDQKIVKGKKYK